jgi:aspartyl-tRNA(Asn)/glutamyl-tRNA(Gln) amidotransferase subunit B
VTYETVVGLEVHSQLKTESKIFCSCPTTFGAPPNTNICPICSGQPGVLPVLNIKAAEFIVKAGLALNCRINRRSVFARKQYFYPDLPKNYQISQYESPVCEGGYLDIEVNGEPKRVRIHRIHLEEDAGKLLHNIGSRELDYSLVDLNRTGVPLIEIVSEPDMRNGEEAAAYLAALKNILEYIQVSDCNMEEGKFRCDANVSIRPLGQEALGTKAELKNMNSIANVRDAIAYEAERQESVLESGGKIVQETRLWDAGQGVSASMRSKEEAHDYRYFPEPDLPPLELSEEFVAAIGASLPELPAHRRARFASELGLSAYDAGVLCADKNLADYFEAVITVSGKDSAKPSANWITTELLGRLNAGGKTITQSPVTHQNMGALLVLLRDNVISGKIGKTVFAEMYVACADPQKIIKERGLVQITDEAAISKLCEQAIAQAPKAVTEY